MSTRERLTNLYEAYLKKRPKQSRSRLLVEAILHAALDRLARTGDEAVLKVEDIAERAGVGVGSVYDYFPDRERLLRATLAKVTEENLVKFERVVAESRSLPLREAIDRITTFAFDEYLRDVRVARAYVRIAAASGVGPVLVRSQDQIAQRLTLDLASRDEVKVEDHEVAAWMLTNALMGVVHTLIWDDDVRVSRERVRAAYVDFAYAYLTRGERP